MTPVRHSELPGLRTYALRACWLAGTLHEIDSMLKLDNQTLLLAFIAVTGLAVLLQAFLLLAIFVTIRKAALSVAKQAEDLRSSMMPVIYNTRELVARMTPKLEGAVDDLATITEGLKKQTAEAQITLGQALDCVRQQTSRMDSMLTGMLNSVDRASRFVNETVAKPVRQVSGIVASVKAFVDALRSAAPAQPRSHAAGKGETNS